MEGLRARGDHPPRRGARVATITREDTREIIALRKAIEPLAARFMLERGDSRLLEPLRATLERLRAAAEDSDWAAVNWFDVEFHGQIYHQSGSRRLLRIWESVSAPLLQAFQFHRDVYASGYSAYESHAALFDVLGSGSIPGAEKAIRRHIDEFASDVIDRLPTASQLDAGDEAA